MKNFVKFLCPLFNTVFLSLILLFVLFENQTYSQSKDRRENDQETIKNPIKFEMEKEGEVWRRGEYFYLRRAGGVGKTIPDNWYGKAILQKEKLWKNQNRMRSASSNPIWESVDQTGLNYGGGIYASGRLVSIAFDPTDPTHIIYIAAANGGVWKTTDGGVTWNCLTNGLSTNASGAIAIDQNNPQIIYYATGELHYSLDSQYGDGVFKSTDGGATWSKIATTSLGNYFSHVLIDPTNSNTIYVCGSNGTYKSTNQGANWFSLNTGSNVHSLIINPLNTRTLYVSLGSASGSPNVIKKSTNGGTAWSVITNGVSSNGRVEIAMAPSDTNILYAGADQTVSSTSTAASVYKTTDGGSTWTQTAHFTTGNYYLGGQGWYDHAITVHPTDPNRVIIGGLDVWKSTNGGVNFYDQTGYNTPPHPDVHVLVYQGTTLYAGTDGGIYRSSNDGTSWTPLNQQISSLQYVGVDYDPGNPNIVMGGTQDNGRTITTDRGANVMQARGGDGGYLCIDPVATNYVYGEFYDISLERSSDGGYHWKSIYPTSASGGLFYCPIEVSSGNHKIVLYGTSDLWKTNDATTVTQSVGWTKIASALVVSGNVSAMTISQSDSNKIYFGTDGGRIGITSDNGTNWSTRTGFNYVSDLAIDQTNDDICYAVFGGFGEHVAKTTDGGATWVDISGNLPNTPVNSIVVRQLTPRMIIVGTDIGVFRSIDDGASWTVFGDGLPSVPVYDLKYKENAKIVLAGTHGRGAFYLDLQSFGLSFSVPFMDFGTVSYFNPEEDSVVVTNGGADTLNITSVSASNSSFVPSPGTGTIAPAGSMTFHVSCTPQSFGNLKGSIVFINDGPSSPDSLPVKVVGLASEFSVSGTPINLGRVRMDTPHTDSITVSNPGNLTLHILNAVSDTGVIHIDAVNDSIAAGGSKKFYYTFQPVSTDIVTGHLVFTDDTPAATHSVTISGRGAVATISVKVFRDRDLNAASMGDDVPAPWHVTLYKDSVAPAAVVLDTVASSWSYNVLVDGMYIISQTDSGGMWVRANGNRTMNDTIMVLPNTTVSDTFINRYYGVAVPLVDRWNLVSAPVTLNNYTYFLMYPDAVSSVYRFDTTGSYVPTTLLMPGRGYWLKFGTAHGDTVLGLETTDAIASVAAGWNLIGSISTPLLRDDIIQDPPGIIASHLFSYGARGYELTDTVTPGRGYWINVTQSGTLELKKSAVPHTAPKALTVLQQLNEITIGDKDGGRQKLFFGRSDGTSASDPLFLMPPAPPAGTFDARFASGRIAELQNSGPAESDMVINIASAAYPVTVSWNITQEGSGEYILADNYGGSLLTTPMPVGEGSAVIKDAKIRSLVIRNGAPSVPLEYALAQNYPNPFNPATSIRYQLPAESRVTLKIFNVVGQEIKTLVNGVQAAGYKSVRWNGTDNALNPVPSGLYFYRIEAADAANPHRTFTQVKKMMLLK